MRSQPPAADRARNISGLIALLLVLGAVICPSARANLPRGYEAIDFFRTPSSNIQCAVVLRTLAEPNGLRCALVSGHRGTDNLDSTWPYFTLLASGRARFERSDDFPDNGDGVAQLPYGATWAIVGGTHKPGPRRNAINCTSRPSGLTCRNRFGHGFTLSRTRQRRF